MLCLVALLRWQLASVVIVWHPPTLTPRVRHRFQLCTVSEDGTCKVENLNPFADHEVGEFCDDSCLVCSSAPVWGGRLYLADTIRPFGAAQESPYPNTCENESPECCDPDISPILCSPCETVLDLEVSPPSHPSPPTAPRLAARSRLLTAITLPPTCASLYSYGEAHRASLAFADRGPRRCTHSCA